MGLYLSTYLPTYLPRYETPRGENPADYLMRVLQMGTHEVDENGQAGRSDLPQVWREKVGEFESTGGSGGDEDGSNADHDAEVAAATSASLPMSSSTASLTAMNIQTSSGGMMMMEDLKALDLGYRTPKWYQVSIPTYLSTYLSANLSRPASFTIKVAIYLPIHTPTFLPIYVYTT